jgi:integrase
MRAIIGAKLIASKTAAPSAKPFEIRDQRLPGFILRVQPSGARSYYAQVGRGQRVALGKVGVLTPDEARERCEKVLGNVAHGRPPMHGLDGAESLTLREFIEKTYEPWLRANRPKAADADLQRLKSCFGTWYGRPLAGITTESIEAWRTERLAAGQSPGSVLRYVMALSGVLSRAVKLRRLGENPTRFVEKTKIDRLPKVRFLSAEEEARLRTALAERDAEMKAARITANAWRSERHKDSLSPLVNFGDHLTPAVLLSINTGLRRGELLALRWTAIDVVHKQLTVEGHTAKSSQTRHVPLNTEALDVLARWREQTADDDRVFPFDSSFKKSWAALLERAKISRFRWHDMRHHFASRLAQGGVPLNTIRELLGHGSLAMTLRYAYLAPDQRREAVDKLTEART